MFVCACAPLQITYRIQDYGCIVYGSARCSYLKVLDPVVHQALRNDLGTFRSTPVESLYVEANEPFFNPTCPTFSVLLF